MDDYFNTFREMASLRGLTDHTIKSYSTYIRAYLDYYMGIHTTFVISYFIYIIFLYTQMK